MPPYTNPRVQRRLIIYPFASGYLIQIGRIIVQTAVCYFWRLSLSFLLSS
jgi:hypothetical protein